MPQLVVTMNVILCALEPVYHQDCVPVRKAGKGLYVMKVGQRELCAIRNYTVFTLSLQILMSVPRVLQDVITYVPTMREDSTALVTLDMQPMLT